MNEETSTNAIPDSVYLSHEFGAASRLLDMAQAILDKNFTTPTHCDHDVDVSELPYYCMTCEETINE